MEGFSSNLNDTFTSNRGCADPMFFPQHILPLLPLYNAQWWGYESLTAIVLVICGHTIRAFIKSFKFGNVIQTILMHKLSIENQTKITISVVKLDLIML